MCRLPPISTLTYTLFPYTTPFRSRGDRPGNRHPDAQGRCANPRYHIQGAPAPGLRRPVDHARSRGFFGRRSGDALAGTSTKTPQTSVYGRSEEHTSELQSLMRISYAVFCLKKKNTTNKKNQYR